MQNQVTTDDIVSRIKSNPEGDSLSLEPDITLEWTPNKKGDWDIKMHWSRKRGRSRSPTILFCSRICDLLWSQK